MTHAYNEIYLSDAKKCLALCMDYAVNACGVVCDMFASLFYVSGVAAQFERGNPAYLAGMSGIELARKVLCKTYPELKLPEYRHRSGRTPEYWAGWSLAHYQWFYGHSFKDIFQKIPFSQIVEMYPVFHEMDITQFLEAMEDLYASRTVEYKLKRIREGCGLSQAELAREANVKLRNIQSYEQGKNSIDKAQASVLYRLSRALGCKIEDLLENPLNP